MNRCSKKNLLDFFWCMVHKTMHKIRHSFTHGCNNDVFVKDLFFGLKETIKIKF